MKYRRLLAPMLAALMLAAALPAPPARAADRPWQRVTSPNFVVYSDAGEKRARAIAERLESFRAMLVSLFPKAVNERQPERLTVVAFRDDGTFKPFKPLYNGKPANISGVFLQGGSERTMVALDASSRESGYRVVFHEYIHKLLSGDDTPPPVWFNEGLAEFYSSAENEGLKARLGTAIAEHMYTLTEKRWMPLARLLSVEHGSPEYNEKDKQSVFYAESWILVHYLMLGEGGKYQKALGQMVTRQRRGEAADAAFAAAFGGLPMAELEKALHTYVGRATYPVYDITYKSRLPVSEATVEPATPAEVQFQLGQVLAFMGRFDDAVPYYRKALELDPASSLPHEGLGFVAMQKGDVAAARGHFAEAVKRDSKSHWALYYFASASLRDGAAWDSPEVRAALEKAVAVNPDFAPPYQMLAQMLAQSGDKKRAVEVARKGLAISPQDAHLRYALASALMADQQFAEAKAELQKVLQSAQEDGLRDVATRALESLSSYEAAVRSHGEAAREGAPGTGETASAEPTGRPELKRRRPEGGGGDVMAGGPPTMTQVRGVLARIDCAGGRLTAYLKVDGRETAYSNPVGDEVSINTLGFFGSETFECGPAIDREAIVFLLPDPAKPGAWVLKMITFTEQKGK